MNFGLILAGMAGFEPAQCQSQSLVPYRLATPHRVTFRIILLINVYVKIQKSKSKNFFDILITLVPNIQKDTPVVCPHIGQKQV